MIYGDRWRVIDQLDKGGQGQVFRVLDLKKIQEEVRSLREVLKANEAGVNPAFRDDDFRRAVLELIKCRDSDYLGALKVLHTPDAARDAANARKRMKNEIDVMSSLQHPGFLKILDKGPLNEWYVSQFCPRGSLANSLAPFKANLSRALRALRPIIEGVAELHNRKNEDGKRYVHRDIKPQNIFLTDSDELVLGDFGLILSEDATRITRTHDNVGSRDWMPPWATRKRIEDIDTKFDVYCLGKTLWSMLSGRPYLSHWYWYKPENSLSELFPRSRHMRTAEKILAKCVVEEHADCLPDAGALLSLVNDILGALESGADFIDGSARTNDGDGRINDPKRLCRACGLGLYRVMDPDFRHRFGLKVGSTVLSILVCERCGYVEFFASGQGVGIRPTAEGLEVTSPESTAAADAATNPEGPSKRVWIEWDESYRSGNVLKIRIVHEEIDTLAPHILAGVALWDKRLNDHIPEGREILVSDHPIRHRRMESHSRNVKQLVVAEPNGFSVLSQNSGQRIGHQAEGVWRVTFKIAIGGEDPFERYLWFEYHPDGNPPLHAARNPALPARW